MELKTFTEMLGDKNALDFNKLKYKFGEENLSGYLETLSENFYYKLPLLDFKGKPMVLLPAKINLTTQLAKSIATSYSSKKYGIQAMEDEIISTLSIEQIDSSRESVRKILKGGAPETSQENKAYGIKRGLDFIAEPANKIVLGSYSHTMGNNSDCARISLVKGNANRRKPLVGTLQGEETCPVKSGQQPEASLAC